MEYRSDISIGIKAHAEEGFSFLKKREGKNASDTIMQPTSEPRSVLYQIMFCDVAWVDKLSTH